MLKINPILWKENKLSNLPLCGEVKKLKSQLSFLEGLQECLTA